MISNDEQRKKCSIADWQYEYSGLPSVMDKNFYYVYKANFMQEICEIFNK